MVYAQLLLDSMERCKQKVRTLVPHDDDVVRTVVVDKLSCNAPHDAGNGSPVAHEQGYGIPIATRTESLRSMWSASVCKVLQIRAAEYTML